MPPRRRRPLSDPDFLERIFRPTGKTPAALPPEPPSRSLTEESIYPSDRVYHVMLRDYGVVWFRPELGDEDDVQRGAINVQGFLRGGRDGQRNRNITRREYERRIEAMSRAFPVSGTIVEGRNAGQYVTSELETRLDRIEDLADREPITGDLWRTE